MANTLKFGDGKWATGEGTALAFNDENENFKPLPFTFTRNSTATVVNESGLIEEVGSDVPRIDFKDNTKGALLLEPSRTNLITYSQEFSNASWVKSNGGVGSNPIVTPNYTSSPLKGYMADRVIFNLNGGNTSSDLSTLQSNTFNLTVGQNITYYMAVKTNDGSTVDMTLNSNLGNTKIKSITPEWTIIKTSTTATATASGVLRLRLRGSELVSNYADISIAYAQLEQGSYATSYIPTSGSAVTRVAEVCNNGGNEQVINSTEGVLYFEGSFKELCRLGISENASTSNRILIGQSSTSLSYIVTSATTPIVSNNVSGYQFNQNLKIAAKYKQNDFALWVNGIEIITVSSGNTPTGLNSLDLKGQGFNFYGNIKDIKLYNTALTDAELITLTT